jgi:outer membrane biogenesis lipoprotein LolB
MRKIVVLIILSFVLAACTVVVKAPTNQDTSIQRSNEAFRELDSH